MGRARQKENHLPQVRRIQLCRWIVLTSGIGGRLSKEVIDFARTLTAATTRDAPAHTRASLFRYFFQEVVWSSSDRMR